MKMIRKITSSGGSCRPITHLASSVFICVRARKTLSTSAPSKIKKIMPVAPAVPYMQARKPFLSSPPERQATTAVATQPMAAASVGVNRPP